jgi:hypothetical protein
MSERHPYIDAFMTKDSMWRKNEIKTIDEKINTELDPYRKDMYRRIKDFWGISCYTLIEWDVKERNKETLNRILVIYHSLEPGNPDMLYFSAFPYLWNGNNKATLSMLKKVWEAGFSDMGQLEKDFPVSITSEL